MAEKIKLVRNDNRPFVTLTITQNDEDRTPVDLTGATINVAFRAVGSTTVLANLSCTLVTPASGICKFNFPGTTLDVPAGAYEGEVEITHVGGDKQTVYDLLKFTVRDEVA